MNYEIITVKQFSIVPMVHGATWEIAVPIQIGERECSLCYNRVVCGGKKRSGHASPSGDTI